MLKANLPFNYLGVPLFKGKPRKKFLKPIVDKIKSKMESWQGKFLSHAGRAILISSVIQPMLFHTMSVYVWPKTLIKQIDTCCSNFL